MLLIYFNTPTTTYATSIFVQVCTDVGYIPGRWYQAVPNLNHVRSVNIIDLAGRFGVVLCRTVQTTAQIYYGCCR